MTKMKNWQVEITAGIFRKFGPVKDPVTKWEIATSNGILGPASDKLIEAKRPPEELEDYQRKNEELVRKYGTRIGDFTAPNGQIFPKYEFHDRNSYDKDLEKLNKEYSKVLEAEPARREGVKKLMETEVELVIAPIDYDAVSELIDTNEVTFLKSLGLLNPPKKAEEAKVLELVN